ncbi:MAG: magnesium chelatase subunit D family protein [Chloroflexota bacterium]|nr:magnesium chelatase subunit D family protein [Chloroflexota bacterium]
MSNVFPFTALVGQDQMKLALVLNAINPKIGGVLIRGEKGTAKSTAVRALAGLLPEIEVTPGCPYNCHPGDACPTHGTEGRNTLSRGSGRGQGEGTQSSVCRPVQIVELPVGATEDRVVGSLDIGGALQEGEVRFRPGLLAAANRGILYIDEVNLLNDHLVDVLLDAAAMGRNYVERESISFEHPSQFLLVGTMNPEEGDLRPQLLDRFALSVDVRGDLAAADRVEVIKRRMAFEGDPARFRRLWHRQEAAERKRILSAQRLLPRVRIAEDMLALIANLCSDFQVDGLRADIGMCKTAITLAAYDGRKHVTVDDVRGAAELALPHRRRRQPFQSPEQGEQELERAIRKHTSGAGGGESNGSEEDGGEQVFEVGEPFKAAPLAAPERRRSATPRLGRRTKTRTETSQGHYVSARRPRGEPRDVALDATIRAAALREARATTKKRLRLQADDVREKVRETRSSNFILFAVDASGSMASMNRMVAAKGAILSLLLDAYQKRDQVGMIAFRGKGSQLLLPPTNSVDLAERELRHLPTGGRTPLSSALQLGHSTIKRHALLHKEDIPLFVMISDGRPNVALQGEDPLQEALRFGDLFARDRIHSVVIDTESGGVRLGLAKQLAEAMGGDYLRLEDLEAGRLAASVRRALGRPN